MSFGFQVFSSSNQIQASTESPLYVCIYSGTVRGFINVSGGRQEDIYSFTYLSGSYTYNRATISGGVGKYPLANRNMCAFGNHRMLVFRPASLVKKNVGGGFGIEVLLANGQTSFTSNQPLMLVKTLAATSYPSLVYHGARETYRIEEQWDSNVILGLYIKVSYVTTGKSLVNADRYYLSYSTLSGHNKLNYTLPAIFLEASHIPLNYNSGDISVSSG